MMTSMKLNATWLKSVAFQRIAHALELNTVILDI